MKSIGVYEIDLWIKGQKFTNPVNLITELNNNIAGIDFYKLIYTRQVKFADSQMNMIFATRQITIPAMTSSIVTTRFNGETPTLPPIIAQDCQTLTPYKVTIERNDLLGLVELENDELFLVTDNTAAKICASIKNKIPKTPRAKLTRDEIARHCNLQVPDEFQEKYINILFKHQEAINLDKYDLGLARNYKHKIHLKNEDPVYQKQFKIPEAHHLFIEQTLEFLAEFQGSPEIQLHNGLLKMTSGLTVPNPDPELMNTQNFNFAKPKLFFKNIGHYAATSTYIHVWIPFNFTKNTKDAIAEVYDKLLDQHDEPFKSITKSVTDVSLVIIFRRFFRRFS
jgi:hypothetical protein